MSLRKKKADDHEGVQGWYDGPPGPQGGEYHGGPQEMSDGERQAFLTMLDFYDAQMQQILEARKGPQDD